MTIVNARTANGLLVALPAKERDAILSKSKQIELTMSEILCEEGDRVRSVYFPVTGFISVLKCVDERSVIEVGMIGSEGMLGCTTVLADQTAPLRAQTQGSGLAWRLSATIFRNQVEEMPRLRQLIFRYCDIVLRQIAQTAACTRFHLVENRLARWLLMTQDRAHADTFTVTQEFLAHMLGVRRAGVTKAASALQARRLIRYTRGTMTIVNRPQLEAAACSCYLTDSQTYRHGIGSDPPKPEFHSSHA